MPPSRTRSNNSGSNGNVATGKNLVRAMLLLGVASLAINFRYYSKIRGAIVGPSDESFDSSDSSSTVIGGGGSSLISKGMGMSVLSSSVRKSENADTKGHRKGKKPKKTFDGELAGGQLIKKDKKGNTVVKVITALNKEDLGDAAGDDDNTQGDMTLEEAIKGREPIIRVLKEAGIQDFDAATVAKLPMWEQVEKLYGKGPVVYGLDTCEAFRNSVPPEDASLASSGIFNSGTNTLAMYMNANCIMPENKKERYGGMRWQVPWGKHMVAKRKWTNTVKSDRKVNKTTVMPIVAIRDPYSWMQSLCRHPYATKWHHTAKHCPNLVPNQDDLDLFPYLENTVPARIDYPERAEHWDSLVHLYNDWYGQYFRADYPRLMVRFEDLLFNVHEMVETVCTCVGGVPREKQFAYVVDSGKFGPGHPEKGASQHTNLIGAMVKYGTDKLRFKGMTDEDLLFAHENLDPELMAAFQYEVPPPP
ncbi:expressed unknown protein [Seminavis robusta]|uniref:Sulfotransferase n=1 Tax=Seminavis robusta TaxID=568900 RepID=A0A9N8EK01_9STRA|nr:expressed unknown protein [Seminavis robusta]|eukprot:Sro1377_g267540.1 n/a (475) ;mRNA; r:11732-13250